jgi:hypothetical protein
MNALYVGDVDVFIPICDIITAYEPLDGFFILFYCWETCQELLGSLDFVLY